MNEIKNKIDEIIIGISSPSKELKKAYSDGIQVQN